MEQIHKCGDPALIASDHSDARREGKQKTAVSYDPIVKYALILRLIVARRHWVGCVTNKLTAGRRQPARTLSTLRSPAHEIEASPQLAQREINSSNAATLSRRFSSPRIVSEVLGAVIGISCPKTPVITRVEPEVLSQAVRRKSF